LSYTKDKGLIIADIQHIYSTGHANSHTKKMLTLYMHDRLDVMFGPIDSTNSMLLIGALDDQALASISYSKWEGAQDYVLVPNNITSMNDLNILSQKSIYILDPERRKRQQKKKGGLEWGTSRLLDHMHIPFFFIFLIFPSFDTVEEEIGKDAPQIQGCCCSYTTTPQSKGFLCNDQRPYLGPSIMLTIISCIYKTHSYVLYSQSNNKCLK
jgi:hypothetical protein